MIKAFRRFLAPPNFLEEEKMRSGALINIMGWSTLLIAAILLVVRIIQGKDINPREANVALIATILSIALVLYLTYRGYSRAASILLVATIWIGLTYLSWIADGIHNFAFFGYAVPILMAGLLLGWQGASTLVLLSILSGWALAYAEARGLLVRTLDSPFYFARDTTGIFLLIGILSYLLIISLQKALNKAQSLTKELTTSNQELNKLQVELQQRMEEQTDELQKHASGMDTISSVARTIAAAQTQGIDELLPSLAKLISQQFGFYHVGVFLVDEQEQQASLRAVNSEGGLQLLQRQYSLPLNDQSPVGYSIVRGEPYLVSEVELARQSVRHPALTATRSQMVIPIWLSGAVLGCLDVHSTEANAFSQDDIAVLTVLADQMSIAIENVRLVGEARAALDESKVLFEKYTKQEWRNFARQVKQTGFVYDGKQVTPFDSREQREAVKTAIQTRTLSLDKASASIAVPVKLRGQTIAVLDVRSKKGEREWDQDEITLLEAAAERVALALENARLIETAQRRAARERAIGDISGKIGAVSNLEAILQTAVEELGRKIGSATEVTLEINSDKEQSSS